MKLDKKAIIEGAKQMLRLGVFAGVSAIITALLTQVAALPESTTTVAFTFILTGIDKWVHENKSIKANGLVPF